MPEITIQGPPLALDPATRSTLLQTVVDSLPIIPNAPDTERTALRQAAFALLSTLAPTDPVEAMFAAQIVAAHFASMNAYRCAARPDLPPALHVRYEAQAATLSRLSSSKRRELLRSQASQPTLPAGFVAAHAAKAQAAAQGAPALPASPAPQPTQAPQPNAAAPRPATPTPAAAPRGGAAAPSQAEIDQLLAKVAASRPSRDDSLKTNAKPDQPGAHAPALLAELTQPLAALTERVKAEAATRKAAATTALAA